MGNLDNYKSKTPAIIGSTTINHSARVRLGLNCSEYVFMDHLSKKNEKGSQADTLTVYISTGFAIGEMEVLFKSLIAKGFILPKGNDFELTMKWEEGFTSIEKEFDNLFWKIEGKVVWTGTRKKALEYYIKLRKSYSAEFLMDQRNKYFNFLELQKNLRKFDQQKVMCQVFLNPSNERYMEDYGDYIEQLYKKYGRPDNVKPEPVTRADIAKAYGKDNNQ
jgi:hypothetical protein